MLITVSGVDGAGKSTQIRLLEETLRASGRRTKVFWYRPGYSDELNALRAVVRRLHPAALPSADAPERRKQAFRRPLVRSAWVQAALADMFAQYSVKLRLWLLRGWTVICDRYVWDAFMDFDLNFPDSLVRARLGARLSEHLAPTPDCAFLLYLSYDEAERRLQLKNEPFPDSPELRARRHEAYSRLAALPVFHTIEASGSIADVRSRILSHLSL